MKTKTSSFLLLLLFITLCKLTTYSQGLKFETTEIDYGKITKGSQTAREFKFTNISKEPIVIESVVGSYGIQIDSYPKTSILPGQSNVIKISVSSSFIGPLNKKITVRLLKNESTISLTVKGEVVAPKSEDGQPDGVN